MEQIKVLIVDDHTLFRQGLTRLLESCEQIKVVGEAGSGLEAVEMAGRLSPDIILMDIKMRRMGGLEAMELIKKGLDIKRPTIKRMCNIVMELEEAEKKKEKKNEEKKD